MAHDVFISYSTEDKPIADAVCASLESRGVRCWIAPRDVLPGVFWAEAIIDAIGEAQLMVLVFSSHSNASSQVMREVERAASRDMPILPLRIENVLPAKSIEFFLSSPHWLDALTPPLQRHLDTLGGNVEALLRRGESQAIDDIQDRERTSLAKDGETSWFAPTGIGRVFATTGWVRRHVIVVAATAAVVLLGGLAIAVRAVANNETTSSAVVSPTAGAEGGAAANARYNEFQPDFPEASYVISQVEDLVLPDGVTKEGSTVLSPLDPDACDDGYVPYDETRLQGFDSDALPAAPEEWLPGDWFPDSRNNSQLALVRKGRALARFQRTADGVLIVTRCYKTFEIPARPPSPYADIALLWLPDGRTWVQGIIRDYDRSYGQPEVDLFLTPACVSDWFPTYGSDDGSISNFPINYAVAPAAIDPGRVRSVRFTFAFERDPVQWCINLP